MKKERLGESDRDLNTSHFSQLNSTRTSEIPCENLNMNLQIKKAANSNEEEKDEQPKSLSLVAMCAFCPKNCIRDPKKDN